MVNVKPFYQTRFDYYHDGRLIKKTLRDGVCEIYNPDTSRLKERSNIDGSYEYFDLNGML
ncbi:MAG: hypothetical protein Q8807_02215 ['Waltheria sp.' little leaf phytoplasma]|nr:hypothetical protein ['Waltheria sp.' little leaf phytoplasma]